MKQLPNKMGAIFKTGFSFTWHTFWIFIYSSSPCLAVNWLRESGVKWVSAQHIKWSVIGRTHGAGWSREGRLFPWFLLCLFLISQTGPAWIRIGLQLSGCKAPFTSTKTPSLWVWVWSMALPLQKKKKIPKDRGWWETASHSHPLTHRTSEL